MCVKNPELAGPLEDFSIAAIEVTNKNTITPVAVCLQSRDDLQQDRGGRTDYGRIRRVPAGDGLFGAIASIYFVLPTLRTRSGPTTKGSLHCSASALTSNGVAARPPTFSKKKSK